MTAERDTSPMHEPLRPWERRFVLGMFLAVAAFAVLVEFRSALMQFRHTDAGVYFRAGWAVRSGADFYEVADDNGWHYAYTPIFAISMVPLADAPKGAPREFMFPYAVSIAVWSLLSIGILAFAIHWIAVALERTSSDPAIRSMPPGCRHWWYARLLPFYICIVPIGGTFSRGQVNILLLAMLARTFLAATRGQSFRSGLWLAAAICLKIIPAFLLIFPIWRRDGRATLGVIAGLIVGFILIPASVWGLSGAIDANRRMLNAVLLPGLAAGGDSTRDKELIEITATDNQSIQAVLHNYLYPDRETRPNQADESTKVVHVLGTVSMTAVLLFAYGWKRWNNPIRDLLFLGGLTIVMSVSSPVSHLHYFMLAVPLAMGVLVSSTSPREVFPKRSTLGLLALVGICFAVPQVPGWEIRREVGLPLLGSMILLGLAIRELCKSAARDCIIHSVLTGDKGEVRRAL